MGHSLVASTIMHCRDQSCCQLHWRFVSRKILISTYSILTALIIKLNDIWTQSSVINCTNLNYKILLKKYLFRSFGKNLLTFSAPMSSTFSDKLLNNAAELSDPQKQWAGLGHGKRKWGMHFPEWTNPLDHSAVSHLLSSIMGLWSIYICPGCKLWTGVEICREDCKNIST